MNFIQKCISHLYWKYCFKKSMLAAHIVAYYAPLVTKECEFVSGNYLFGIINAHIKEHNVECWCPPAGTKEGDILPLAQVCYNGPIASTEAPTIITDKCPFYVDELYGEHWCENYKIIPACNNNVSKCDAMK